MEKFRHIRETAQVDNSEKTELPAERDPIHQVDEYDQATEIEPEQIQVREYLDSIDEGALKEIYEEYFRKSGADDTTMNWIPLNKVRILCETPKEQEQTQSALGSESTGQGIQIYSHRLANDPEKILWTLIHEQCHAISQDRWRNSVTYDEDTEEDIQTSVLRSGVATTSVVKQHNQSQPPDRVVRFDDPINEGITQLLTERIFREYRKRTGTETYNKNHPSSEGPTRLTESTVAEQKFDTYERNWKNIKMYVGIIASLTDTPKDIVEESVIRTYIRNGEIAPFVFDFETEEVLAEISPELSGILLSILDSKKDRDPSLNELVTYINSQPIPDQSKEKILLALQEIKNEWGEAYKLAPNEV